MVIRRALIRLCDTAVHPSDRTSVCVLRTFSHGARFQTGPRRLAAPREYRRAAAVAWLIHAPSELGLSAAFTLSIYHQVIGAQKVQCIASNGVFEVPLGCVGSKSEITQMPSLPTSRTLRSGG